MAVAITFMALLVRLFLCDQMACLSRDGVQFITFAKELAESPVETMRSTTKQPGYSFAVLGVHHLLNPLLGENGPLAWQRAGQLIPLFCGVAVCPLVMVLTRRLFDGTTAIVAGVLAAFWWQGAQLSADVLSDIPHLMLYLTALLAAGRAVEKESVARMAVSGGILGLAYLLRQEAVGLLAGVALCRLIPPQPWRIARRDRVIAVAALVAAFAVVAAPYSLAVGRLMPNKGFHDLWRLLGGGSAVEPSSHLLGAVVCWYEAPVRMLEAWGKSGRYAYSTLALVAFFWKRAATADAGWRRLVLVAVIFQIILTQLRASSYDHQISTRYMLLPAALSLPWAASGLVALLDRLLAPAKSGNAARAGLLVLGLIAPLIPQIVYHLRPINGECWAYRAAGRWLDEQVSAGELVMAHDRLEQLMFYAGRARPNDAEWLRFPEAADLAETAAQIHHRRPVWFVDGETGSRSLGDESAYTIGLQAGLADRLVPVWAGGSPRCRVLIFRIVPDSEH